ncbi:MAG: hypothetical protein ACREDR_03720 [Blastocatellia bacterium]
MDEGPLASLFVGRPDSAKYSTADPIIHQLAGTFSKTEGGTSEARFGPASITGIA